MSSYNIKLLVLAQLWWNDLFKYHSTIIFIKNPKEISASVFYGPSPEDE